MTARQSGAPTGPESPMWRDEAAPSSPERLWRSLAGRASINDAEVWRTARDVIERHGQVALYHAASRSERLLDAGDAGSAVAWRKVSLAVRLLQRPRPAPRHTG